MTTRFRHYTGIWNNLNYNLLWSAWTKIKFKLHTDRYEARILNLETRFNVEHAPRVNSPDLPFSPEANSRVSKTNPSTSLNHSHSRRKRRPRRHGEAEQPRYEWLKIIIKPPFHSLVVGERESKLLQQIMQMPLSEICVCLLKCWKCTSEHL